MWKWQSSGNGDVAVLSTVLFLRALTPARLWADLARGALGRSALNVGRVWQGLFSIGSGVGRSRARKSAEGRIPAREAGSA